MTDFSGIKAGDRVRLVYEFTSTEGYRGDEFVKSKETDMPYYIQDLVSVEKIAPPLPTEDGWYESEKYPLSGGSQPYELRGGDWYVSGGGYPMPEKYVRDVLAPLYRLGRVDG